MITFDFVYMHVYANYDFLIKKNHRHAMLTENCQLTPKDCWAVLSAAKNDFLAVIAKVYPDDSGTLEMTECSLVLYYLQAVVILKHLQRPGVVEHMTVSITIHL